MNPSILSFVPPAGATSEEVGEQVPGWLGDLAATTDLEALLERFLGPIIELAGAQAGAVRVLTDEGQHMRLVAHKGLPHDVLVAERLVASNCGMCGVAATGDVLGWVDDIQACARHGTATYFGPQCKSVLAISLAHGKQALGIYNLFFEAPRDIHPQTQTILRLIGQLLGMSLHNARIERERLRLTVLRERQEMVNEVHDVIAQTMAYVRMRLPLLSDAMLAHDDQKSIKYFSDVKTAVGEVHDNLREVMTYFRTRMDPLGLLHALKGIAGSYFDRTGIELNIRNKARTLNLSDEQEVQVFHVVQEALANIAKHSMARRAVISITRSPGMLEVVVEDDGLGLSAPSVSTIVTTAKGMEATTHMGLDIMQERARRLGGTLELGESVSGGTRVCLLFPVQPVGMETRT